MGRQLSLYKAPASAVVCRSCGARNALAALRCVGCDDELAPAPVSRSRRKRGVRSMSISTRQMTRRSIEQGRAAYPPEELADVERPHTRADCERVCRPCPFVSCVHHLYLDVSAKSGSLKLNFPDLEPDELPPDSSCSLDVAERVKEEGRELPLEAVAERMNLTRERIRQVEIVAMAKLQASRELEALRDHYGAGTNDPTRRRRLPIVQSAPRDVVDADRFAGDELDED